MKLFDAPLLGQPAGVPTLAVRSPYARKLLFHAPVHPVWGVRDLVSGVAGAKTGLTTGVSTAAGILPLFGSSSYADFTAPAAFDGSLPFTIAWVQQPISPAGYSTVLDVRPSLNSANSFLIYQSASDSTYQFVVGPRDGGSNGKQAKFATGLQTSGQLDVYVLVAPSGLATASAAYVLYRNGVRQAAAVASPDFGAASPTGMRMGSVLGTPGDPFEGGLGGLTIWQAALDDQQAAAWRPERMLAAPRRLNVPGFAAGGAATFAATPSGIATASAALTTGIRLAAGTAAVASASASLVVGARLAAAPLAAAAASAALSTAIRLSAAPAAVATATAALSVGFGLAASPSALATASASLTTSIWLVATPMAVASASANLSAGSGLAASPTAVAGATAALTTAVRLASSPAASAAVSADLLVPKPLAATAVSTASASATLGVASAQFGAAPAAVTTVTAALSTGIRLAASPVATATANASLNATAALFAATPSALTTVSAALLTGISLAATPAGRAASTAALQTAIYLAGAAQARATATLGLYTSLSLFADAQVAASATAALSTYVLPLGKSGGFFIVPPETRYFMVPEEVGR